MAKQRQYEEVKYKLADAVSEAFGEVSSLAEEMREAFDNTPESLQQSGVGEARGEAADNLENINEIVVPDELSELEFTYQVLKRTMNQRMKLSRSSRRDDATMLLDACIDCLDKIIDDEKNKQSLRDSADELRGELDNAKGEIEGIEFPGMYG